MFEHDGQFHCILYQRPGFCSLVHSCVSPNSYSFIYSIEILRDDEIPNAIHQYFFYIYPKFRIPLYQNPDSRGMLPAVRQLVQ